MPLRVFLIVLLTAIALGGLTVLVAGDMFATREVSVGALIIVLVLLVRNLFRRT